MKTLRRSTTEIIKSNPTLWGRLKAFLWEFSVGDTITRKDILKCCAVRYSSSNQHTLDKWRRQLTVVGYLKETEVRGQYVKALEIPQTLSSRELEKQYNGVRIAYPSGFYKLLNKEVNLNRFHSIMNNEVEIKTIKKNFCKTCYMRSRCKKSCIGYRYYYATTVTAVLEAVFKEVEKANLGLNNS